MRKSLFFLAAFSYFLLFSSCNAGIDHPKDNEGIKPGTKLKITYIVDSAYFRVPENAPKYHVYGKETIIPNLEEKNGLVKLMTHKYWTDGTKTHLTSLGATDYTTDIYLSYVFSFDEKTCNTDDYVMINGICEIKATCEEGTYYDKKRNICLSPSSCEDDEFFNSTTLTCDKKPQCNDNDFYNAETNTCEPKAVCNTSEFFDSSTNSCFCDEENGYVLFNGECVLKPICGSNQYYEESENACIDMCTENVVDVELSILKRCDTATGRYDPIFIPDLCICIEPYIQDGYMYYCEEYHIVREEHFCVDRYGKPIRAGEDGFANEGDKYHSTCLSDGTWSEY